MCQSVIWNDGDVEPSYLLSVGGCRHLLSESHQHLVWLPPLTLSRPYRVIISSVISCSSP